jgi:hypothetical protein
VVVETKSLGFALRYRQAGPEEEVRIRSVLDTWFAQVERLSRHQILREKR